MSFMASMMQMVCPLVTLSPSFTKGGSPGAGERYIMPAIGDATCAHEQRSMFSSERSILGLDTANPTVYVQ